MTSRGSTRVRTTKPGTHYSPPHSYFAPPLQHPLACSYHHLPSLPPPPSFLPQCLPVSSRLPSFAYLPLRCLLFPLLSSRRLLSSFPLLSLPFTISLHSFIYFPFTVYSPPFLSFPFPSPFLYISSFPFLSFHCPFACFPFHFCRRLFSLPFHSLHRPFAFLPSFPYLSSFLRPFHSFRQPFSLSIPFAFCPSPPFLPFPITVPSPSFLFTTFPFLSPFLLLPSSAPSLRLPSPFSPFHSFHRPLSPLS